MIEELRYVAFRARVEVVDAQDVVAEPKQPRTQMRADETGTASDEHSLFKGGSHRAVNCLQPMREVGIVHARRKRSVKYTPVQVSSMRAIRRGARSATST